MDSRKVLLSAAMAGLIAAGALSKSAPAFANDDHHDDHAKKAGDKDHCKGKDKCDGKDAAKKKKKGDKDACSGHDGCNGKDAKDDDAKKDEAHH